MPKKHGASHALAAFVGTIASGIMMELFKEYIPFIRSSFFVVGTYLSELIFKSTNKYISPEVLSIALLTSIIAFIWGIAFKYMHKD